MKDDPIFETCPIEITGTPMGLIGGRAGADF